MSFKRYLGKIFLYLVLEVGALCGVPMRPDQIEEIMRLSEPKITQVKRDEGLDDLIPPAPPG